MIKLADEDTGEVFPTSVVCRLFDLDTCRCTHYALRHRLIPDWRPPGFRDGATTTTGCLSPAPTAAWPGGRDLAWWHPLVSGDPQTVVDAGISVRGNVISARAVHPDEPLEAYVLRWVNEP